MVLPPGRNSVRQHVSLDKDESIRRAPRVTGAVVRLSIQEADLTPMSKPHRSSGRHRIRLTSSVRAVAL